MDITVLCLNCPTLYLATMTTARGSTDDPMVQPKREAAADHGKGKVSGSTSKLTEKSMPTADWITLDASALGDRV